MSRRSVTIGVVGGIASVAFSAVVVRGAFGSWEHLREQVRAHWSVLAPFGLVLRPEIAAPLVSGSSLIVAVNAVVLKRLRLPTEGAEQAPAEGETAEQPPQISFIR